MIDKITTFFETASLTQVLLVGIGGLLIGALFIGAVVLCFRIERNSEVSSHSLAKIIIIAVGPVAVSILSFFELEVPLTIGLVVTAAAAVAVTVWNIVSLGLFRGLLFSVVHIVAGFLAGISVIALLGVAVVAIIFSVFGGLDGGMAGGASGGSTPEYVRDVNSGASYYVTEHNGSLWLEERGVIIRPGAYSGRFIDDSGNEYIAC